MTLASLSHVIEMPLATPRRMILGSLSRFRLDYA